MSLVRSQSVLVRVEKIDRLLREGTSVTLARLVEALGVTERTICRDLVFMKRELGLPVAHAPGKAYHYASAVPPFDRWEVRRIAGLAREEDPKQGEDRTRACLEALHEALCARRGVLLHTRDAGEEWTEMAFHPFFFSRIAGELVLFGRRPDTGALLNLPLRRIEAVEPLEESCEAWPVGEARVREGEGWFPAGSAHLVRLRFTAGTTWAKDLQLAEGQVREENGGVSVFTFRTDDLERVRQLAALLGDAVIVEEPADLGSALGKS